MQSLEHISQMLLWSAQQYNEQPADSFSGKGYYSGLTLGYFLVLELTTVLYYEGLETGLFDIEAIKELLKDAK